MTDAKLRQIARLLSDLSPERLAAALDTVAPVEPGMAPWKVAALIRSVVRSWEAIVAAGRLP